jgi:isopentenyl-diphosphate Delta-isomerase
VTEKVTRRSTPSRKQDHVELVVGEDVTFKEKSAGFDHLRFEHNALPEINLSDVSLMSTILGHTLGAPLIISSMTGGYADAEKINGGLARAAAKYGLAIGVGSERQAIESTTYHTSFSVIRKEAPDAFVFANLGAVELRKIVQTKQWGNLDRIVDLVGAQALAIHLNPLQELMQPEGAPEFEGILDSIGAAATKLTIPVIVKEVGAGISGTVARLLLDRGVRAIDVAGAGGTSWAGVEILRHEKKRRSALEPFWDWGIPTVECLQSIAPFKQTYDFTLIASGGIRNGIDIAKSIACGADAGAIARPFIRTLVESGEEVLHTFIEELLFQLRGAMFLTGSRDLQALREKQLFPLLP